MKPAVTMTSMLMGGVCALALVGPSMAQTAAQPAGAASEPATVEEVMVTGSRIVRDGYEAPTPTTVIGQADIQTRAPANIADYVNQLPQLGAPTSPRTTLNSSGTTGGGANLLNARGLGATRTLVLLDGRRVVSAGLNSAVDVNLLPTNLVSRVDVVTGGASAAYGSDAVAGVINFVLDTNFTGMKGGVNLGVTDRKDAENYGGNLALGAKLFGGRGHILLSGQYMNAHGIDDVTSRPWYVGFRQISNPAFTVGGNQPANITGTDIGWAKMTQGGLITSGPLRGVNFGPNGALLPNFVFGPLQNGNLQKGGTKVDTADVWGLLPALENWSTFGRVSFDLTDNIVAYAEASWGGSNSGNFSAPYYRQGDIVIRNDNPFIPDAIRATAFAPGSTTFNMGRLNYDLVQPGGHPTDIDYIRRQKRFVAGLDGSFGASGKWHTYYQRGESNVTFKYSNEPIVGNFDRAVDAVANPAVGGVAGVPVGTPVCRSTLTDPTNGCVPVNLFGVGSPSLAAINYITGVSAGLQPRQDTKVTQDVWAIDAQYEPFSTWAGPVSVAGGFEWRKEQFTSVADSASLANLWYAGFKGSQGEYTVKEFFGETIVPVLRDAPFVKSLDVNGAVRRTDYSTSGKVTTWKAGFTWDINGDLILRGTRSRDIRAPNLGDLFNGGSASVNDLRDSSQPGRPLVSTTQISSGNPNLKPEIAKTWTFGGSYRPSFAPGLGLSVDYYKIDVADAIVSLGAQTIIDTCYGVGVTQNTAVCGNIIRANPDNLNRATILTGGVNAQKQTVEGVDYELSYRTDVERFFSGAPGSLDFRALASQRLTSKTSLNGTVTDNLGTTGDGPKWRANISATYTFGPSRTTAVVRYLGAGKFNNYPLGNALSVEGNHFDSVAYLDLTENFDIDVDGHKVTLFGVVENVFDKDPPPVPGAFQNYGVSSLHDLLGRLYRVGARFQF